MTFVHGRNTTVLFNEVDHTGYLDGGNLSVDVDTAETTTFGRAWKTYVVGVGNATVGFTGNYSPLLTEPRTELQVEDGVLTFCPGGGSTIGDRARLLAVTATNYSESASVGDRVLFAWDVTSDESVGFGWMLHPLAEDTNTTTGASRDDAAATSTGWMAHLHVTAVDGGSWVIKLQDSADNSSWADVTSGAFTAATGAASQRLSSAAATSQLRRYVRYIATRTGGTAGDGITFALAYARSR